MNHYHLCSCWRDKALDIGCIPATCHLSNQPHVQWNKLGEATKESMSALTYHVASHKQNLRLVKIKQLNWRRSADGDRWVVTTWPAVTSSDGNLSVNCKRRLRYIEWKTYSTFETRSRKETVMASVESASKTVGPLTALYTWYQWYLDLKPP